MKTIKVAAPAKINLTLEIVGKRPDGFHNIKSIMQAINLYDYLTFKVCDSQSMSIELTGNSDKIPYDERNLVYKACVKYFEKTGISNKKIEVFIEKNIPVEAGLAGGSTDAAATFYALNTIFDNKLSQKEIDDMCASLGSDLNFCYHGGTALCSSRGEQTEKLHTPDLDITLIKPLGFGISAKEAYTKFAALPMEKKTFKDNSKKMIESLRESFESSFMCNSLEDAVIDDYEDLKFIKKQIPFSMMSGSGPTFFCLEKTCPFVFDSSKFLVIEGLKSVKDGVKQV